MRRGVMRVAWGSIGVAMLAVACSHDDFGMGLTSFGSGFAEASASGPPETTSSSGVVEGSSGEEAGSADGSSGRAESDGSDDASDSSGVTAATAEGGCEPTAELCNGIDDDCNGTIDDGDPEGGVACATTSQGICAEGTTECDDGEVVCRQDVQPGVESCNAIDDDCDGVVDDGDPGGGSPCDTGQPGICSEGTQVCSGGALVCDADVVAGVEQCGNSLDDDCDGIVDDGCGCSHDECTEGVVLDESCSPCVEAICAADPFCCSDSWDNICILEVAAVCGVFCIGTCDHSPCEAGNVLVDGCDPGGCVSEVCLNDPFCCNTEWDVFCVDEVATYCGILC